MQFYDIIPFLFRSLYFFDCEVELLQYIHAELNYLNHLFLLSVCDRRHVATLLLSI